MNSNRTFVAMILLSVSVFLSWMAGLVAAFPLMPTRWVLGPKLFWGLNFAVGGSLLALGQYEWGGVFVVLTILLGSFTEFESRGDTLQSAAACSILVTLIVSAGLFGAIYSIYGSEIIQAIKTTFDSTFVSLNEMYNQRFGQELVSEEMVAAIKMQAPSFVVMGLIVSLVFGLLGESRLLKLSGVRGGPKKFYKLNAFRLHDVFIWLFIFSLLGSFWQYENQAVKTVSANVLNVTVLLLFLQGLAVMSKFYQVFRIGTFWRVFWTVLLIVQLSMGIVILGLIDYWLDFRGRMLKHAAQLKEGQKKHSGRK